MCIYHTMTLKSRSDYAQKKNDVKRRKGGPENSLDKILEKNKTCAGV